MKEVSVMPMDLQVLKARMQGHALVGPDSEFADNILKKIIDAIFGDDDGCDSCQNGCQTTCQGGCSPGCSGGGRA
jgi:hypothetical protein